MRIKHLALGIITSFILHLLILQGHWKLKNPMVLFAKKSDSDNHSKLKLRVVGQEDGKKKGLVLPDKDKGVAKIKKTKNELTLPSITPFDTPPAESKVRPIKRRRNSLLAPKKAIDNLRISNNQIKNYIKEDNLNDSPKNVISAMDFTDVNFDLVVPKGVKEDELNKYEMVFYSFRRRAALAYVNSFYKELNQFEQRNPHLRFPLTQRKQQIAGKITYDKNGDILKIETLKWSQITKLQDFFMDVLKNMSAIPNPPEEIINKEDKFVINFVLTINETKTQ